MRIDALQLPGLTRLASFAGPPATLVAHADAAAWIGVAAEAGRDGGRLVTMWGAEDRGGAFTVCAAYALEDGLLWVRLPLGHGSSGGGEYPDLSALFPCAVRMQRAIHDLTGLRACGAGDVRPWLNHGNWPADYFPLRKSASGTERFESHEADYAFTRVAGDGVHEIAVGPIHAGIIEPGHFRFSVVGEKVLRLEERLGYVHRGIERLFERTPALAGHRVAGRIAGDSTVAFAWAYCMALERAFDTNIPPRAQWLRALLLERERVANHLGDLGALGNDAGFAFGLAQFSRMKEDWLRLNERIFGHRYLFDAIEPGGLARDLSQQGANAIVAQSERIEREVRSMRRIYDDHPGLQDRFTRTGILTPQVAADFGVCGLVARASGAAMDLRVEHGPSPYREIGARVASDKRGDVAARVAVRFREIDESLRQIRAIITGLPAGSVAAQPETGRPPSYGAGWIEGWRGDVLVALETGEDGTLARCHCHDPSWQNWPALEVAIIGNIVADFPLINKSFNLCYAGHDL
ncbi:hydrogenase large subunit [Paraburkholderia lycopersici]|uniref:Ni,Fe-hydrogenase III large subunit n=1 Tax=Paraburkholderia lycopersici TaxID=416944 RepID=A0A1G6QPU3_9BURK|nr:NADH-quinone oxidoreductase subunit C [Paraburkholderia lycopersici]SDC94359.1 Ni,Fe-hydrogenase III large subunit [Paraburkholderia lycopersici]